jgi:hypothetical protein
VSKTVSAIVVLVAAAGLWVVLTLLTDSDPSSALDLGKKYLGFTASLAGILGIAIGGGSLLTTDQPSAPQTLSAVAATLTGLLVALAGGAMIGGDPLVPAAALVGGGLWGLGYVWRRQSDSRVETE